MDVKTVCRRGYQSANRLISAPLTPSPQLLLFNLDFVERRPDAHRGSLQRSFSWISPHRRVSNWFGVFFLFSDNQRDKQWPSNLTFILQSEESGDSLRKIKNTISFHLGSSEETHCVTSPEPRTAYAASWPVLCSAPSLPCHEWGNPRKQKQILKVIHEV